MWQTEKAAIKAFVVTRFGDTAFALGIFFLFTSLGTLQIQEIMHRARLNGRKGLVWLFWPLRFFSEERWANPLNCPCRPGCRTQWPVLRR